MAKHRSRGEHAHIYVEGRCIACGTAPHWPRAEEACDTMGIFRSKLRSAARKACWRARADLMPPWYVAWWQRQAENGRVAVAERVALLRERARQRARRAA